MRERTAEFLESSFGKRLFMAIILANAVLVGVSTYSSSGTELDGVLGYIDGVIIGVFTLELLLRFYAAGSLRSFFEDPWNVFDLVVVTACYVPALGATMSVARTLRVLRTLRAIAVFPTLRKIVGALLRSLPAMGHVAFLLFILVYVYAVIGTSIFGNDVPQFFGTLHRTALTLFQVVTLEGWNDLLFAVMEKYPYGWIYFATFIFLGTFSLFNLFVGVIVHNLEEVTSEPAQAAREKADKEEIDALQALVAEVRALRERVERLG